MSYRKKLHLPHVSSLCSTAVPVDLVPGTHTNTHSNPHRNAPTRTHTNAHRFNCSMVVPVAFLMIYTNTHTSTLSHCSPKHTPTWAVSARGDAWQRQASWDTLCSGMIIKRRSSRLKVTRLSHYFMPLTVPFPPDSHVAQPSLHITATTPPPSSGLSS